MQEATSDRSIGALLQDLARSLPDLVRAELRLAQAEASDKFNQATMAVVSILAGFLLALAGLIILLQALAVVLANFMPDWLAVLIVGGGTAAIAFGLVIKGKNDLSAARLAPEKTMRSLRRDADLAKESTE